MKRTTLGFSLIELLVVLVIVGIVAVVTGNWYGAAQPSAVKGTVNSVAGAVNEARAVARATGRTVTLTTGGSQANLTISFPSQGDDALAVPATQPTTTWLRSASGTAATKYAGVDAAGTWTIYSQAKPTPDPLVDVKAITGLLTVTSGVTSAPENLFNNSQPKSPLSFDATGRASRDFYVFVGGMRSSASYTSAPVGLVLVSRTNGIHAFYKPNAGDATVPWQRL